MSRARLILLNLLLLGVTFIWFAFTTLPAAMVFDAPGSLEYWLPWMLFGYVFLFYPLVFFCVILSQIWFSRSAKKAFLVAVIPYVYGSPMLMFLVYALYFSDMA